MMSDDELFVQSDGHSDTGKSQVPFQKAIKLDTDCSPGSDHEEQPISEPKAMAMAPGSPGKLAPFCSGEVRKEISQLTRT